jgi:spore coat protein U-like protein
MQIARASPPPLRHNAPRRRTGLLALLALMLCAGIDQVHAAVDCSIASISLNFGAYDPALTAPDDSVGSVTLTCRHISGGADRVNYTVTLSNGQYGTSAATRAMGAGAKRLGYNVFTDPARTQAWGTGTGGTVIASGAMTVGPGNGNNVKTVVHSVYGRIPQLQDVAPGIYADTLLVTLTF